MQPGRSPADPETTVPQPGSVGAMNSAGEAPLFPAGASLVAQLGPEAWQRDRARAATRGMAGMEGDSTLGEDAGKGFLRCQGHRSLLRRS